MIRAVTRLAIAALIVTACAHAGTAGTENIRPQAGPRDRSILFGEELHSSGDQNLYDAVQRLRPEWLRLHGSTSVATGMRGSTDPDPIRVYVGAVRVGGPEFLTRLPINNADSLRFFTAAQAQGRFGPGNTNGVIQIITAVPPPPSD